VKKFPLFLNFDPRLKAELRGQRRLIVLGLICVLVAVILEAGIYKLVSYSIASVQEAAPIALTESERERIAANEMRDRASQIAPRLERSEDEVFQSLMRHWTEARTFEDAGLPSSLAADLGVPESLVLTALGQDRPRAVGNPAALERLAYYIVAIILLFSLKYWFTRGQAFYLSAAGARLATDMRLKLFAKLQRLPVSYFNDKRAGGIYSVLTNDVNVYQNSVWIVRDSIDGPLKAVVFFAVIFFTQWQLAIVSLLIIPPMAYVIQRNGKRMRARQAVVQDDLGEVGAMTNEALMGTRVVRAFAAESVVQQTYSRFVEKSYASQLEAIRTQASLRPLVELIGAVMLAIVIYICGWLSYGGALNLGQIALLVLALDKINQGFRSIGGVANMYNMVQAATNRIYSEVLDVAEAADADHGHTLPHLTGRIEFRDVTFAYPDGTEAVKNVNFVIEPGTSLALVGPSGAGKSTIADLLLRFYDPSGGQILIDGVDIRELNISWLRKQIGVVPQQTFLFAGTIAENIRLGKEDATDDELRAAANAAHAQEFINNLPESYRTQIGESGIRLSGGQRQRLAIARALVRRPTILLLDEATSALDPASEKAVTEALGQIMQERTTLFIAHRLTTAARADRILVLRRGEVVELGSHKELMEQGGVYAGLFQAFSGGVLA
jgi:ATP-binding cassette, subfamily B, bacterial MsbA